MHMEKRYAMHEIRLGSYRIDHEVLELSHAAKPLSRT